MKKCYYKFTRMMAVATALGVFATSCSDDETSYPANVYFTGAQDPVKVVSADGTKDVNSGMAAFNVTFDASSDWSIAAHTLFKPEETADWVKFFANNGQEGSQLLGVYVDPNTSAEDRAASVDITCQGSTISFTLIQKADVAVVNPNSQSIDGNKTVSKIEYLNNAGEIVSTYSFTYTDGDILSKVEVKDYDNDEVLLIEDYTVTSDATATKDGISVNRVVINKDKDPQGHSFAVVNGKTVLGYACSTVQLDMTGKYYNFAYDNNLNPTSITGNNLSVNLGWATGNMTSEKFNAENLTATYGSELNNSNLDLNWYLGFLEPGYGLDYRSNVLGAMNLLGKRSAYLASSVTNGNGVVNLTYTPGVVDKDGKTLSGLTVQMANGKYPTAKVYFAD